MKVFSPSSFFFFFFFFFFLNFLFLSFFQGRHILCEKHGKIMECWKKLQEGWLDDGKQVPGPDFGRVRHLTTITIHIHIHNLIS